uniref:Uncharacterized protein n=1 Tax=Monodelphis domestica TaxID=13616 RepID=A0A5F8H5J4_MONDO
MEAMVSKVEMMLQKTKFDLDYIQYELQFEVKETLPKISSEKKKNYRYCTHVTWHWHFLI